MQKRAYLERFTLVLSFLLASALPAIGEAQNLAACVNTSITSAKGSLAYDAGGARCVVGNSGCDSNLTSFVPERTIMAPQRALMRSRDIRPESLHSNDCERALLSSTIPWITSAIFVDENNSLLAINANGREIIEISPNGEVRANNPTMQWASQIGSPLYVDKIKSDYLLFFADAQATVFNPNRNTRFPTSDFAGHSGTLGSAMASSTDMAIAGDNLVAYTSWPERSTHGFVNATLQGTPPVLTNSKLLLELKKQDYYLIGHHYLAAIGEEMFFIAMGDTATLYEYSKGPAPRKLNAIPQKFTKVPELPIATGKSSLKPKFDKLEISTVVTGLYAQGRFLYLLTREPNNGATQWHLHQIDPALDRLIGSTLLPTHASHLTVVPSPNTWYFFEKSSLDNRGRQSIKSLLEIPTSWINSPKQSPIGESSKEIASCRVLSVEGTATDLAVEAQPAGVQK